MLSAGLCGPVGYSSVGKTMLCHSMGGHYFAGLFSLGYYAGYIVFGFYLARFIPLPVLGAFIFAIGMELLVEWLVHYRKKVTRVEYQETVVLFLIMTLNFVVGFFLGIFFSLIVFASRYADVPVIKAGERKSLLPCLLACFFPYLARLLACLSCDCASLVTGATTMPDGNANNANGTLAAVMDGSEYHGRSTFSGHDTMVLKKWGGKILTVRLQGFIFFFTAERLRSDLLTLIQAPERQLPSRTVEYLILDFR